MSDMYALFEKEKVDANKFDNVDKEGASRLSNLIRQSIQIQKEIEDAEQHLKDLKFKKRKCLRSPKYENISNVLLNQEYF